ncbi:MAG: protein kinase, partial [Myxococcota bacterium]
VQGHNLLQVMARCARRGQPFPFDVALFITSRMLSALQYAHDQEQIHGDVSPTNVMVTAEGKVQMVDFGIRIASTRLRGPAGLNRGLGRRFASYISPEQASGEPPTPQADVFVAGILLYELLTGRVLFSGVDEAKIVKTLAEGTYRVPVDVHRPDLHPGLVHLVRRALAPSADDRFPDARAFFDAIQELVLRMGLSLSRTFVKSLMQQLFPDLRSNYPA